MKIDFQATTQCEAGALSDFLGRMFPHSDAAFLAETAHGLEVLVGPPGLGGFAQFYRPA